MFDFNISKFKNFFNHKNLYWVLYGLIFIFCCFVRVDLYLFANDIHMDEAKIALELNEKSYSELFNPLGRHQVAPYIFLVLVKFVYNLLAHFSTNITYHDLVLRIIPLLAGIVCIPCFAWLLNKLFKNRAITLLGMLLLALNHTSIVYSTVCKQYSFEELITVVVLILFLKIDFKKQFLYNYIIFICLGFSLFCSMTALFILPGGFLYLILKRVNKTYIKQFLACFGIFLLIFAAYIINFLLPLYDAHFINQVNGFYLKLEKYNYSLYKSLYAICQFIFRTSKFADVLAFSSLLSLVLILVKKVNDALLYVSPVFITIFMCCIKYYPLQERLLVFLIPCLIILILYLLTLIPRKYIYKNVITYILLFIFFIYGITHIPEKKYINGMQFQDKALWNYFIQNYKNDGVVLACPIDSSLIYYNSLSLKLDLYHCDHYSTNLPEGTYYLITARGNKINKNIKRLFLDKKKSKILQMRILNGWKIYNCFFVGEKPSRVSKAIYIKFKILK